MRGEARIVNHSSGARAQPNKVLDVTGRAALMTCDSKGENILMITHLCGFWVKI